MTKIRRNSTREVVRAVTIVKIYRRPYPHHGNTSSCSRTLIVWKQSLEPRPTGLEALEMAHPRGGFSYVLACNSADSESREPVLQPVMYPRMYHPCFAEGSRQPLWEPLTGSRQASTSENILNPAGAGKGHSGAVALAKQCPEQLGVGDYPYRQCATVRPGVTSRVNPAD